MARGGNNPVTIPANVKVNISSGSIMVEGPKGKLNISYPLNVKVESKEGKVFVIKTSNETQVKANQGTIRAKIATLIKGVTEQFTKTLLIEGVGFKAAVEGNKLSMVLGYTDPVVLELPVGVTAVVEKNTTIVLKGSDKDVLGDFAAVVRKSKIPDPYKAKGVRYLGEHITRKAGKTAGGATTGGK